MSESPRSIGANERSTASHGLSLLSCDLSEPIREHGLSRTRPHRFESPIGLSRTPGDAVILGAAWLISRLNALLRPVESDRPLTHSGRESDPRGYLTDFTAKRIASHGRVRSDSHCLTDRTLKSVRPWEAVHGLSDRSHDFVVRGRGSPSTASQIWESDLWGRSASHTQRAMQSDPRLNALHRPVCVRGRSASQIGLSNLWGRARTPTASHLTDHRSDSLTDLTMWQIWQIHFIAI